jgi:hypothetical protein
MKAKKPAMTDVLPYALPAAPGRRTFFDARLATPLHYSSVRLIVTSLQI